MTPSPTLDSLRPLLNRMASTLWPVMRESVTPIAVIQGERTIQWGTGTFFRVADESFLVTASHVWDKAERHGFGQDLYVFDLDGPIADNTGLGPVAHSGLRPVQFTGTVHRAKDPPDVAVFELDAATVSELHNRRFLRLGEVRLLQRQPGNCWVFGFPEESTEEIPSRSIFRYQQFFLLAPPCTRDLALEGYDPNFHFLLEAARDDLWLTDGSQGQMPNQLGGISGCSVWQTDWPKDNAPDRWKPDSTRIVGIQTSYYRKPSVIKATYWRAVANVLYQVKPALRDAIELNLGPPK